jgi:hypothetical protein
MKQTTLRCSPRTGDIGKSHPLRGTPPSRLSALGGVYAPFLGVLLGGVKRHNKKSTPYFHLKSIEVLNKNDHFYLSSFLSAYETADD